MKTQKKHICKSGNCDHKGQCVCRECKQQHTLLEVHEGQDYVHIYGPGHDDSSKPMAIVANKAIAQSFVRAVNEYDSDKATIKALLRLVKRHLEWIENHKWDASVEDRDWKLEAKTVIAQAEKGCSK